MRVVSRKPRQEYQVRARWQIAKKNKELTALCDRRASRRCAHRPCGHGYRDHHRTGLILSISKKGSSPMAARLVEVEETLFDLRDQLNATSDGGTKKPIISKEKRKRLNEALDLGEAMVSRFGEMMRGLKEDAEKLGSKLID